MKKYSCRHIQMSEIKRIFPGFFPLQRVGFIENMDVRAYSEFSGKLELCFRFSAEGKASHDIINGIEYKTPFPNIFLKVPQLRHGYLCHEKRDAIYFFYDAELYERMKFHGLLEPPYIWHFEMNNEIASAFKRIAELSEHVLEYGVADQLDMLALQLFQNVLLRRVHPAETVYEQSIETKIRRIASYLKLNFNKDIQLEELYTKNGFSRRSFFRHWKQYYSLSPMQYIQDMKLDYACIRLLETSMSVGDICAELNFKNQHYLSWLFKKNFGITPLQYRRKNSYQQLKSAEIPD